MTPDICFFVFAHVRHVRQKFWQTYVIKYGDLMVILEPCYPRNDPKKQNFLKMKKKYLEIFSFYIRET